MQVVQHGGSLAATQPNLDPKATNLHKGMSHEPAACSAFAPVQHLHSPTQEM